MYLIVEGSLHFYQHSLSLRNVTVIVYFEVNYNAFPFQMTMMTMEEPEQERKQATVIATAASPVTETAMDTETLTEHSSQEEEGQQQQHSGVEQMTYSRMAHLLAVYQNKVRSPRVVTRLLYMLKAI